jgi:GDP-L-fucose synthase
MDKTDRIFLAGHRGLVGSAILSELTTRGFSDVLVQTRQDLDLTRQAEVETFFLTERPAYVFLAAAKVGGIHANHTRRAEFITENLQIQTNVIDAAYRAGVRKLVFLGSSCIYPRNAAQPMKESELLTGPLEPTNEPYAIAKIAGIKTCQAYRDQYGFDAISLMPTNLYGPFDNFDLEGSHVVPALIRKFYEAKEGGKPFVEIWGTGSPMREFLYVDDMAAASVFLMQNYSSREIINVGTGEEVSIRELAGLIKEVSGFGGEVKFDRSKPDGTPRKLLDVSRIHDLGWRATISLREGLERTYAWYVKTASYSRGSAGNSRGSAGN